MTSLLTLNRCLAFFLSCAVLATAGAPARAQAPAPTPPPEPARPAWEVNVLWPFVGISELKLVLPAAGTSAGPRARGEIVTGAYLDYAQFIRPNAGKAFIVAGMLGYRQFFWRGAHAEIAIDLGIRHESHHPGDDATLNDIYARAWPAAGYELDLSPRFYVNARARAGLLVYRQTHWSEEKKVVIAGDINIGARF
jgi:hypothetical protein